MSSLLLYTSAQFCLHWSQLCWWAKVWSLCIWFSISLEKFCWWSSFWSVCIYINFSPWISLNSVWKGADLAELSMATEHCPTPASFPKALLILISGAFLLRSTLPLRYVPSRFGYADHKALVLLTSAGWEQSPPVAVVGTCKPWLPPGPGGVAVVARSARLCRVPLLAQMSPFVGVTDRVVRRVAASAGWWVEMS